MRRMTLAVVLFVLAAVGLAVWTMSSDSGPVEQVPSAGNVQKPAQASPAAPLETTEADSSVEPPARIPDIPPPSAAWLQAPANPLRVTITLDAREAQRRISPAGGTMGTTLPDGTRVSLMFPPGSLWRSEDVTMRVVQDVRDAPFAAVPMAVSISPEDLPLRRSPILVFEPGRRSTFDGTAGMAGFAVRAGELSLYPAFSAEIDRAPGRYRISLPLTRLGAYGVTNATESETAAARLREPSDPGARLDARIAAAYASTAPAAPVATVSTWTLFPRLHAQDGVSLFIYELLKQVLEYYQQVVVPKFDKLPTSDCLSGATFDAIDTYLHWRAGVELLLPMQRQPGPFDEVFERLVIQRRTLLEKRRGYTPAQIDEIDRAIEGFRDDFNRMTAEIDARIRPALSGQFATLYGCCTGPRPMMYHLAAMQRVLRFGELNGYAPVDPDPMPKLMECACIVGASQPGAEERYTGTFTYEENTSLEKTEQKSSRTASSSYKLQFSQSGVLVFSNRGGMLADSVVTGSLARFASVTDDHGTCVVHGETQVDVDGRDQHTDQVSINVNVQRGTYTLGFSPAPLDADGRRRSIWHVKGPGCGKFNKPRDETEWTNQGVSPVSMQTVKGSLDASRPTELKGSHVFEEEDRAYNATRRATLNWDLQRCSR